MARLQLSKATLSQQRKQLQAYQRFLPSLDMKRQQLMQAVKLCEKECRQLRSELDTIVAHVGDELPMLANDRVDLQGLCTVRQVHTEEINIAGVPVRSLLDIEFNLPAIAPLSKPHWVFPVQQRLQAVLMRQVKITIKQRQHNVLQAELTKVTQRVNLFDKVLIPQAQSNIRRIQIYLDDRAREAVVTSKIAKAKHRDGFQ